MPSTTQKDYVFDYRMIASDKRVVWLHDIVSVVATEGVPERLRGYMFDITERKVAEEELNRYRNHLEQIVEQRTAELAKANEQLTSDLVERSRTEELIRQSFVKLLLPLRRPWISEPSWIPSWSRSITFFPILLPRLGY